MGVYKEGNMAVVGTCICRKRKDATLHEVDEGHFFVDAASCIIIFDYLGIAKVVVRIRINDSRSCIQGWEDGTCSRVCTGVLVFCERACFVHGVMFARVSQRNAV